MELRWRVLHIAALGAFRDLVRRCTVFRIGGFVGRVRSARIGVVRLALRSCFVLLPMHFYLAMAFVGSISLIRLLLDFRGLDIT